MTIEPLLKELRGRDIRLWAEGDRLKFEAPPGALTDELRGRLRENKGAILARLAEARPVDDAIPRVDRALPIPLSFTQQSMWFLWKLAPESPAYNVPTAIELRGRLDALALGEALRTIQRRHEVLRTRFSEQGGVVLQVIDEQPLTRLRTVFLEQNLASEDHVQRLMRDEAARPFDLRSEAPLDAVLYKLADDVHWFFLKLHHIAYDGWSNTILLRELFALYRARVEGTPCALQELPVQYADYAAWQRDRLEGNARQRLAAYWKRQLREGVTVLRLPTDRPRPAVRSMQGSHLGFQLSPELSQQLADLSREQNATMFMLLMSAFRILLGRYSGQSDFLIATPSIWRKRPEIEHLIGYFGNTLLLRNPLAAADTYLDVIARERRTALDAYEHQELPFETLREELGAERASVDATRFQVMFLFGERQRETYELPELEVAFSLLSTATAKFDILLWMEEGPQGLSGDFEYDSELFDAETVDQLARHLQAVLAAMAAAPRESIHAACLLTVPEREQVVQAWNATARPLDGEQLVHELFEAQVAQDPAALAVCFEHERVSYGALNQQANRVAGALLERGVEPEQLVGVYLSRSPALIATLLGVLKAGAAYVPLDPDYPAERTRFVLEDSGVELVLTADEVRRRLPAGTHELICVDALEVGATIPAGRARADGLAYVLYTSGSTGRPKGVAVEHGSVRALVDWARQVYTSAELAGVLAATSVCFDLSIFEVFVPLSCGGALVLAEDALALPRLPARDQVTLINTVPSAMRALLKGHEEAFSERLRVVNLAGEFLETALVDDVFRRTVAAKVFDLYGPTEATTYSLFQRRLPGYPPRVGRPIANTRGYVLDERGVPVPVGVAGELFLAGAGLARGYLNRPDLTAERFVGPPSDLIPETRLYRTGDRVRHTRSGELEYLGRTDHQVKIRGYRVEPGEVQATLLTLAGVADAVVLGRERAGDVSLAAYFVADDSHVTVDVARRHLQDLLPGFMVPALLARLDSLPRRPNGKVDFGQLEDVAVGDGVAEPPAPPQSDTERQVLAVWQDVLSSGHGGRNDSFFELGGHSLTAMLATARLSETFDVDLPLRSFFEYPTVAELAGEIERLQARGSGLPRLTPLAGDRAPLSLLQRHFWLFHHVARRPELFNIAQRTRFRGDFDVAAARRAVAYLAERHPILRARFVVDSAPLRQEVVPGTLPEFVVEDLSGEPDPAAQRRAFEAVNNYAGRPFRLADGACCRFVIARLSASDHVLIMVLHHIVVDEWSLAILANEFAASYAALSAGAEPALEPRRTTFFDYATWEERCREGDLFSEQLALWADMLRPPLSQLTFAWQADADRRVAAGLTGYPVRLDEDLCGALAAVARRERTSMFVVLLTALKCLLQQESGAEDIRVCTNVARRHWRGVEGMVGPLTDTLILRTRLPGDCGPAAVLGAVRHTFAAACGPQDVPFETVAAHLRQTCGTAKEDLAQVFFMFHEAGTTVPLPGLASEDAASIADSEGDFFKSAVHDYDLVLYLHGGAGGVTGQLTLRACRDEADEVGASLARRYAALLERLAQT
ncbi:amino acid adenylation domain-containing protein [Planctomycetota bacterium]|nr:amino acid adenylation domain-containing protein [Planctomycetota bacterium]